MLTVQGSFSSFLFGCWLGVFSDPHDWLGVVGSWGWRLCVMFSFLAFMVRLVRVHAFVSGFLLLSRLLVLFFWGGY